MKTLVLTHPGRLDRTETPEPGPPGPDEAVVRVHRVGICGTDLHAYCGRQPFFHYPRILGHELGALVLAVGAGVTHVRPGDRVAVEPYLECGTCWPCRQGRYNCCERMQVLGVHVDGGMREQICVPARKLRRSERLTLDQLALVETLAIGAHAVARAAPRAGETLLVIGAGPIGLATAVFGLLAAARVFVLERQEARRSAARRLLAGASAAGGPPAVFEPAEPDGLASHVAQQCGGALPSCVLDATGSRASMEAAFGLAVSGGRLVLVGFQTEPLTFANPEFHRRELTLLASRNSTAAEFGRVMELMEAGRIDATPWITHRAGYDELARALPAWLEPDTAPVKGLLHLE